MPIIIYKFNDGTVSKTEVSEEFYAKFQKIIQEEKRIHWKETRRHKSLELLSEKGEDYFVENNDSLSCLLKQDEKNRFERKLDILSDSQRELLERVYIDGTSMTDIAKEEGVADSTIRNRMLRIIKKLKNFL